MFEIFDLSFWRDAFQFLIKSSLKFTAIYISLIISPQDHKLEEIKNRRTISYF